ncbi:Cys-tRNA(Pro) deacylase [Ruminococcaceae bacterium OttesenSCG-928-A16]|nr:Cys-tRNA(Pro) deacylase [Ruminococcaceae bacterium OttesenSCG-928-A16]
MKQTKTNAMRLLEAENIPYTAHEYAVDDGALDGVSVAHKTGQPPARVFKTLVTHGAGGFFVYCVPVAQELNLKAAAKAAGQKSIQMIPVADITRVTGYVKGGCSPFGMKKTYPTFLDETALDWDSILVSGGRIGTQIEVAPKDLLNLLNGVAAQLTV